MDLLKYVTEKAYIPPVSVYHRRMITIDVPTEVKFVSVFSNRIPYVQVVSPPSSGKQKICLKRKIKDLQSISLIFSKV